MMDSDTRKQPYFNLQLEFLITFTMFIQWAVIFKTAEPLPRVRDRRHDLLRAPCAYLTR